MIYAYSKFGIIMTQFTSKLENAPTIKTETFSNTHYMEYCMFISKFAQLHSTLLV